MFSDYESKRYLKQIDSLKTSVFMSYIREARLERRENKNICERKKNKLINNGKLGNLDLPFVFFEYTLE